MMRIEPFLAEHFTRLHLQGAQAYLSDWLTPDIAVTLEKSFAFSAMVGDTVIGCAGILPLWTGRAAAWSYLGRNSGAHFTAIHRSVLRALDECGHHRIEISVDCDFQEGHRWARMLGFTLEAERMRGYRPDGGDCALYARVR